MTESAATNSRNALPTASGLDPSRFETAKFATVAADLLRDLILDGTFGPGERLNEAALSERLQISRSPIREALRSLSGQGLVRMVANRGAYVESYTVEMLRELAVVRESLECVAVRLAVEVMTEEQMRLAFEMMERVTRSLAEGQASFAGPHTADFHALIADGSGNSQLASIVKAVESKFMIARARSGSNPERAWIAHREHEAILTAINDRDAAAAAEAMSAHLATSLASMLSTLNLPQR
jgi:DNA-binding GntR family transcriptional regulator